MLVELVLNNKFMKILTSNSLFMKIKNPRQIEGDW